MAGEHWRDEYPAGPGHAAGNAPASLPQPGHFGANPEAGPEPEQPAPHAMAGLHWVDLGPDLAALEVGEDAAGQAWLLFGLDWRPLLGSQIPRQALQRARSLRATHYAWRGDLAASVACVRLQWRGLRARPLYAAALLVAQRCGHGTFAIRLHGGTRGVWLVAVHDGVVISGSDRWYASPEEAAEALRSLQQRYPALLETDLGLAIGDLLPKDVQAGGATLAQDWTAARLVRVPTGMHWSWWGLVATIGVAGWLLAPLLSRAPAVPPDDSSEQLAAQAWQGVYDDYAAPRRVHDGAALRGLLQGVAALPLRRQGWLLEQIECRVNLVGWRCAGRYRRAVGVADNNGLLHRWPGEWQVAYDGFDQARVVWQVSGGRLMDWRRLPADASLLAGPVAVLQRQAPVFERITLGDSQPVSLPEPVGPDGMPLAPLPGMPVLKERAVAISGALRGLPLLQDVHWPVSWERLMVEVRPPSMVPEETESRLVAHLQGVVYGRD
ncbi:hypothetical protein CBF45_05505 [Bordetella sp. J329]|nr:hypothetical protein CBF45_05505 [Bordetella sp. J329]